MLMVEDLGEWQEKMRRAIASNISVTEEITVRGKAVEVVIAPIAEKDYINVYARDITKRKKMEGEREHFQKQLFQSQKMETVGTMANGIAHNFNNILGAIRGYADMALDEIPDGTIAQGDIVNIKKGIDRAQVLVQKMMMFSRKHDSTMQKMDLVDIVQGAIELFKVAAPSDVRITTRIDIEKGSCWSMVDQNQIQQVIVNLCNNSLHAVKTNRSGEIVVSLSLIDGASNSDQRQYFGDVRHLLISVQDNGCGMEKETLQRVFEPFFTTKEVGKGTGLGLAMVHGIIDTHKGTVTVSSVPGEGTTFNVYLPCVDE
jgi:two-component system, cell cycle sensor histidine kinase and response regulator CckA